MHPELNVSISIIDLFTTPVGCRPATAAGQMSVINYYVSLLRSSLRLNRADK